MRFAKQDIVYCVNNAPSFENGLIIVQSGVEQKDIDSLVTWLRRLCGKTSGISFLLIVSTHDSEGCFSLTVHTGKAGRPKRIIKGKRAVPHYHCLIINVSKGTSIEAIKCKVSHYLNNRRSKRTNLKRQKIQRIEEMFFVKYMLRQADSTYRGGTFDFDYFTNDLYISCE